MSDPHAEWERIVEAIRAFNLRYFGDETDGITSHLRHRGNAHMPFPPRKIVERPQAAESERAEYTGPPTHSSDFQVVKWPELGRFVFSPMQAKVVARLWQAWEEGVPAVRQDVLLRAAESDSGRLLDIFRRSSAWGVLILQAGPGSYTLPDAPSARSEDEQSGGE